MPPDSSYVPDYVSDRGPTEYFHGRVRILANFGKLVKDSMDTGGGSTFLIQGAPGVGKTALLYVLSKRAKERGWRIAEIKPTALWTPNELRRSLGQKVRSKLPKNVQIGLQMGQAGVVAEWALATTQSILDAGKRPLLLILDEAQTLGTTNKPPSQELEGVATNVLDSIHNGGLERPVILLTAGLGPTLEAFETLGVSRFKEGCVVELGALSKASERAVIQDWLVKEGGAKGDPAPWIDAIAQQTHGWPRHVHSYAEHAAGHLKEKGGIMTPQGLKIVMELGEEGRKQYYKQRVSKFYGDQLQCLVTSIANTPFGEPTSRLEIVSSLAQTYGNDQAEDLLKDFIEKGILEKSGKGLSISIPSMHTWLKEEYGHERIEPTRERKARPTPPKDFGMER